MTPTPLRAIAVLAIGDSVMIGAATQLQEAIPGVAIDAAQGRQAWSAAEILRAYVASGRASGTVVSITLFSARRSAPGILFLSIGTS